MLYNYIGYAGAVLYLLGFFLLSIRRITGTSRSFQLYNLCGAIGVSIAAIYNHDAPSIVLNVAWGSIALATILFGLSGPRS
jgi:membrane associated rhomboid family serine protease